MAFYWEGYSRTLLGWFVQNTLCMRALYLGKEGGPTTNIFSHGHSPKKENPWRPHLFHSYLFNPFVYSLGGRTHYTQLRGMGARSSNGNDWPSVFHKRDTTLKTREEGEGNTGACFLLVLKGFSKGKKKRKMLLDEISSLYISPGLQVLHVEPILQTPPRIPHAPLTELGPDFNSSRASGIIVL